MNKEETVGARRPVPIAELPSRLIYEFAFLTAGALGTFAVTAIAAVRREIHHVLAIFSKELDGAFLGHMCALESPEDARESALDLLAGELRSVASMNRETLDVLSSKSLGLHIDTLASNGMLTSNGIEVPIAHARKFPEGGLKNVEDSRSHQVVSGTKDAPSKSKAVNVRNVGYLFHRGSGSAEDAHFRFARLASFRTEVFDRTRLPDTWVPTLTLGTLIVAIKADGSVDEQRYLLYTQPRCDSVRLKEQRMFPFQAVSVATEDQFNLVAAVPIGGEAPSTIRLMIGPKPHDTRMLTFAPNNAERVQATAKEGRFSFVDVQHNAYMWIGDLRDLTAQRAASSVASRMHEVGLDEYEWLRLRAGK